MNEQVTNRKLLYHLLERDNEEGFRIITPNIVGREEAYKRLNEVKRKVSNPDDFRVLPKPEAEKLREGIRIGRRLAKRKRARSPHGHVYLGLSDRS